MVNKYITLNSLKYYTTGLSHTAITRKAQQINVTIGAKTVNQDFGFTDSRWTVSILVYLTPPNSGYGGRDDLITAYGLSSVTFIDGEGNSNSVFIENDITEALNVTILDDSLPFVVPLSLRKKQV